MTKGQAIDSSLGLALTRRRHALGSGVITDYWPWRAIAKASHCRHSQHIDRFHVVLLYGVGSPSACQPLLKGTSSKSALLRQSADC